MLQNAWATARYLRETLIKSKILGLANAAHCVLKITKRICSHPTSAVDILVSHVYVVKSSSQTHQRTAVR